MNINKFFKELSFQDYITLGYLYLVIIGVINIVIYYSSFNINIFDYIAITDILLAPINMLFLDYWSTVTIIFITLIVSFLSKYLIQGFNILLKKFSEQKSFQIKPFEIQPVIIFLICFSYIFLQMSISMADGVSSRIKTKAFKPNTTLFFTDNSKKNVRVIATTSMYIFYAETGEDIINITPISGNIKAIKDFVSN